MTNTELAYREIPLPVGPYNSRMAALNACLKAITTSHLQVEKVAIFEEPPHAFLQISQYKTDTLRPKKPRRWLNRLIKTSGHQHEMTTLKLMVRRKRSSESRFILKYEINP